MSWSLIGRMPYAGRCWVWTNTESIKESEDLESTRDFKTISGRVSDVRKKGEWVRIWKTDVLRVRVSHEGVQCILRSCRVSRTAQSFFESGLEDVDLSWSDLDAQALAEAKLDFGQSLQHVQQCHRRGKAFCQDSVDIPVELAFCLSQVWRKVRSGGLLLFRSWALALSRARIVVLLLGIGRTFARLVVRPVKSQTLVQTYFQKIWSSGFMGEFSFLFPVSASIA